jgi:hypothetical protein
VHREHRCREEEFDASIGVHGTGSENSLRETDVAVLARWLGSRAGIAYERAGRPHSPAPGRALRGSQASVARRTAVGLAQVPIEVAKPPSGRVLSGTGESLTSQAAPQGAHEHALRHAWLSADTHAPSSKFAQKWLCLFLRYSGPPSCPVQSSMYSAVFCVYLVCIQLYLVCIQMCFVFSCVSCVF